MLLELIYNWITEEKPDCKFTNEHCSCEIFLYRDGTGEGFWADVRVCPDCQEEGANPEIELALEVLSQLQMVANTETNVN